MKTKTKLFLTAMLSALLFCACIVGGVSLQSHTVRADGLTVGAFHTGDGYTFAGTSESPEENRTAISYRWSAAGLFHTRVTVKGYTSGNIELGLRADKDANVRVVLFSVDGGWDIYYPDLLSTTNLTAGQLREWTLDPTESLKGKTEFDIGFYFDSDTVTAETKTVVVEKLTVAGTGYIPAEYTGPAVVAPDKAFKDYTEWTATEGTVTASDLEKLPDTTGTVDEGIARWDIDANASAPQLVVPFSQEFETMPDTWSNLYVKYKFTNVSDVNVYVNEAISDNGIAYGISNNGAWNVTVTPSVTDGFEVSEAVVKAYIDKTNDNFIGVDSFISLVMVPVVIDSTQPATVEFGGMTLDNGTPTFSTDIGTPELSVGGWITYNGYKIQENATLGDTGYSGVLITYTSDIIASASLSATVSNFNAEKYPLLHISFYTDSDIVMGVAENWNLFADAPATQFAAGYHSIEIDMSGKTYANNSFDLRFYFDSLSGKPEFDGEKNVVLTSVIFQKPLEIDMAAATSNGLFADITADDDGSLTWHYDAKDAGAYYFVSMPLNNWYAYNRYLVIDMTIDSETVIGVWINSSGCVMDHTKLGAGRYTLYLDTAYSLSQSWVTENGYNTINIYCDVNNASATSLVKNVTINSATFVEQAEYTTSPNANAISVNYAEETVSYEEGFEVSMTSDFAEILESGAKVAPGTTLYLRTAGSATTIVTLAKRAVITEATAPTYYAEENFISFGSSNYEYKLGEDGTWTNEGFWDGLEADTEYVVYIRIAATDSAYTSEEYRMTVRTAASGTDSGSDSDTGISSGSGSGSTDCESCTGASAASSAMFAGLLGAMALVLKKRR